VKLRAQGFSRNNRQGLVGTIVVLTDEDDPTGIEHYGNYSRDAEAGLLKKLEGTDIDPDTVRSQLRQLLKELRVVADAAAEAPRASAGTTNRPEIRVNNRFMRDITQDSLTVLQEANRLGPVFFRRGDALVDLVEGARGIQACVMTMPALTGHLDRLADFLVVTESEIKPTRPPEYVVKDLLALADLPLPPLNGILSIPVLVQGGRLLAEDGYDWGTGLLLHLDGLPTVSRMHLAVERARQLLLEELLGDFPFVDQASRAHALALALEPFVRRIIDGPTPIYLVDAPTPGTGKGLLIDVVAFLALGYSPAVMAPPTNESETRKAITSMLVEGAPIVVIDNIQGILASAALAAAVTATQWTDRILGQNRMVTLLVSLTWIAAGNNVTLSHELTRRAVLIRMDAGVPTPAERPGQQFRHPNLSRWVREHREELVCACITLVQEWVAAGMPQGKTTMGRFESWAGVMSGILETVGVPGFLDNRHRLRDVADQEYQEWQAFCTAWWREFGSLPVTAGRLFRLVKRKGLLVDIWGGRTDLSASQRLGRALHAKRDVTFGNWKIFYLGLDAQSRLSQYRLISTEESIL
jgi:hypothetical protein